MEHNCAVVKLGSKDLHIPAKAVACCMVVVSSATEEENFKSEIKGGELSESIEWKEGDVMIMLGNSIIESKGYGVVTVYLQNLFKKTV